MSCTEGPHGVVWRQTVRTTTRGTNLNQDKIFHAKSEATLRIISISEAIGALSRPWGITRAVWGAVWPHLVSKCWEFTPRPSQGLYHSPWSVTQIMRGQVWCALVFNPHNLEPNNIQGPLHKTLHSLCDLTRAVGSSLECHLFQKLSKNEISSSNKIVQLPGHYNRICSTI